MQHSASYKSSQRFKTVYLKIISQKGVFDHVCYRTHIILYKQLFMIKFYPISILSFDDNFQSILGFQYATVNINDIQSFLIFLDQNFLFSVYILPSLKNVFYFCFFLFQISYLHSYIKVPYLNCGVIRGFRINCCSFMTSLYIIKIFLNGCHHLSFTQYFVWR